MRRMTVIVFAREPIPGRTKTRLIPAIGKHNAAALADAFNRDALAKAKTLGSAELVIAGSAPGGARRSRYFKTLAQRIRRMDSGPGHRVTSARGWRRRCAPSPTPAGRC